MKKFYFPIYAKFILILLILSTAPLIIISFQTTRILQPALQTIYGEIHTKLVTNIATKIQSYFFSLSQLLPFIEEIISSYDISWENKQSILQSLLDVNKNIVSISILDDSGKEKVKIYNPDLLENPKLLNFAQDTNFNKIKNSNLKKLFGKIYTDNNIYKIDAFYKKEINKTKQFYILISLTLNPMFEEFKEQRVGRTGFINVIDAQHKTLIFTNAYDIKLSSSLLQHPILNEAVKSVSIGSKEFLHNKIQYIASYITVPEINWVILLCQEKNEAYKSSILLTQQIFRIIVLVLLISIIISFLIATGISKPILKLVSAAKTVALGNFNVTVEIKTYDELETLGETFNHMAKKLNEYAEIQLDKLIAEKTKTEAIIFSIHDGIILTNYNGDILLINNRAKEILGLKSGEPLENQNIFSLLDKKLQPVFETIIKEPNKYIELDLSTENFSRIYQTSAVPVTTLKGEKIGLVSILHDITLEKELDRLKDDFLHSITHDLRNPMTSIRGFIKFLSDGTAGELNEQQKKMLEIMDRASYRLLGMINDILDIAKLEAGKMELKIEPVDLVSLVKSVLEIAQPQYERKKINVKFITQKPQVYANVDGRLIERVYTNLLGNAIKFTPEEGTITIYLEETDEKIFSYVQDTGEGIPPEYINTIFEKFAQVKNKSKGGTGLGLTICKYVIEAHKGKIWAESELGKGAKFSFFIPKINVSNEQQKILLQNNSIKITTV